MTKSAPGKVFIAYLPKERTEEIIQKEFKEDGEDPEFFYIKRNQTPGMFRINRDRSTGVLDVSFPVFDQNGEGAVILSGGFEEDNVLMPTILTNVKSTSKVSCQEVFALIVTVTPIKSIQEGIHSINDSKYGLQAGIFTNYIQTALEASQKLHVGGVMINDIATYKVDQMPYGGVKESGNTKEGIKYAIEEMTEAKLVVWNQNF